MMNCPYCNCEMEKGYIEQTRLFFPLVWSPLKGEATIFPSSKKDIKLTAMSKGGRLITHYCSNCKKFVIDQNEVTV